MVANSNHPAPGHGAGWRLIARFWRGFWQTIEAPANRWQVALGALLIFLLVLAIYRPILPGAFLMDDWRIIETKNALSNHELTPLNLWFSTDFTLSTFALWLQYLAWGHNPAGYHAVNLLLHGLGAVILWRVLAKLRVPGAWLAAALYAVHPVCVNSVARIAEIKNTLSLPFFLLSFWAYLQYEATALYPAVNDQSGAPRPRYWATFWYVLALLAFVAALLAKTSTIMLPMVLIICAVWQRGRAGWKDWLHVSPFFGLSLAFGLMSVWFQKHQALTSTNIQLAPESFWQHVAVAGHVFWFYLSKALMPVNLAFVYPQWRPDLAAATSYLPHLAACVTAVVCWRFYRSWGRHVLFGLGGFAVTLFPALGFFDSQFLTHWQVSDHLQYLPLIFPVALAVAWLACWRVKDLARALAVGALAGLAFLTYERAGVFTSDEKLLRDSIAKNPGDGYSLSDLGAILARQNHMPDAMDLFERAVKLNPDNADAHSNLGHMFAAMGRMGEAGSEFQAALALDPSDTNTRKMYASLLQQEGKNPEALTQLRIALIYKPDSQTRLSLAAAYFQAGNSHDAAMLFRQVLQSDPENVEALNDLAWLLATSGDANERNGNDAVRYAEKACSITGYKQAKLTGTLAAAYAEAGRFSEAVTTGQMTVKLANDAGYQRMASITSQLLNLYQNQQPYHTPAEAR